MPSKQKIFFAGIIIGTLFVFYIPDSECDQVGAFFCSISPIIGYIAYAVSGMIVLYEVGKILKKACRSCLTRFRGHRRRYSEPLLRDSFQGF
jgi:hypothetical protein